MESILKICNAFGGELCHVFRSEKVFRKNFYLVHKHTSLELSLITSGRGKYLTPSGAHEIAEGDVLTQLLHRKRERNTSKKEKMPAFCIFFIRTSQCRTRLSRQRIRFIIMIARIKSKVHDIFLPSMYCFHICACFSEAKKENIVL